MLEGFADAMAGRVGTVFNEHPELVDHRAEHPWLTGWLGDPDSPVWFIAENPSATQVDRIHAEGGTPELQWAASSGDRLLREALVEHGLKDGDLFSPGGWRCYITDVMKSEVLVSDWQNESTEVKDHVANCWAPVLRYEFAAGSPRLVIVLGDNANKALRRLRRDGLLPALPPLHKVHHYSYVMSYPAGKRPPGDPQRQAEWKAEIGRIASLASSF